jgi:hypothetical protein
VRMLGYFTNTLAKLNRYIERENSALPAGSAFVRELALQVKFPNKAGKDIPRFLDFATQSQRAKSKDERTFEESAEFTKSQIRLIVKRLERQESFKFEHAIDCLGPPNCHCDEIRTREFRGLVKTLNHKLPAAVLEMLI